MTTTPPAGEAPQETPSSPPTITFQESYTSFLLQEEAPEIPEAKLSQFFKDFFRRKAKA